MMELQSGESSVEADSVLASEIAGVKKGAWLSGTLGAIDRVTDIGNICAALCLLGLFALIIAELVARNIFGTSISFTWDVAAYLMGGCFMLAAASGLKAGSHVRVTAIGEMLPSRGGWMLEVAACLIGLVICIALSRALVDMAWVSFMRGSTASSVVRIPLVYPQALLAAGSLLMTLQMIAQSLRLLRGEKLATGPGLE
jgi:TRAP-type C4-dicarboxylate transport system permease small subunit